MQIQGSTTAECRTGTKGRKQVEPSSPAERDGKPLEEMPVDEAQVAEGRGEAAARTNYQA